MGTYQLKAVASKDGTSTTASNTFSIAKTAYVAPASEPAPEPTPATGLTESVVTDKISYMLGQNVQITARVLSNGSPVSGAVVDVRVARPNGSIQKLSATSGSDGVARLTHSIGWNRKEIGGYSLTAVAVKNGASVSATTGFQVR